MFTEHELTDVPGRTRGEVFPGGEDDARRPRRGTPPARTAVIRLPDDDAVTSDHDATASGATRADHRVVQVDGQAYTVVEGDLLLDEDELDVWTQAQSLQAGLREFAATVATGTSRGAPVLHGQDERAQLVGMQQDGRFVRWAPGTVLTYCVLSRTFSRREWYEEVVENMLAATRAWQETCGVVFRHVTELDGDRSTRPSGVVFPVRHVNASGAFVAASFFPNDPPQRRRVLVDPSYYSTGFDHVGVLRHEIGHVLGFRHEHIRSGAPPVCPDEDTTGTVDLTAYDPQSVMHYFCGGVGTRSLAITTVDRAGSQRVYGPPLSSFVDVDPDADQT